MTETERLQRQIALLKEGLKWALKEGGWRLWYYADTPPSIIRVGPIGEAAIINTELLEGVG